MKSDVRASCWSITVNNPIQADEDNIAKARQLGWKVEGQKEVGETGTPHYQLLVESGQVRFSSIKKAFPRAHIEVCRDKTALKKYVHKEETRVEGLPAASDNYPSQQKVWDMMAHWIDENYPETDGSSNLVELWNEDRWLHEFDRFISEYILDGYVLEGIAVNPQVRSGLKKFGLSIYRRSQQREYGGYVRRQTDRQTDKSSVCDTSITDADEETTSLCGEQDSFLKEDTQSESISRGTDSDGRSQTGGGETDF